MAAVNGTQVYPSKAPQESFCLSLVQGPQHGVQVLTVGQVAMSSPEEPRSGETGGITALSSAPRPDILVIGAGLAGLNAACILQQAGVRVTVLEAAKRPGGRVHSSVVDGFTLDYGYPVLFPAYPAVRRSLDLAALDLVPLLPGAALRQGQQEWILGSPFGDFAGFLSATASDKLTISDKVTLARLGAEVRLSAAHQLLNGPDESTQAFLRGYGFSEAALDHFFRPFFGGIFLLRDLSTSARLFRYYLRMLLDGGAALPRRGMSEIPQQLSRGLDLRCGVRVERLHSDDAGVQVRTSAGDFSAKQVIVATDPPTAAALTGADTRRPGVGSTYLHYATNQQIDDQPRLLLNLGGGLINNAHWLSNAIPERARAGQHLLVVTVLGQPETDEAALDQAVRGELATWYGTQQAAALRTLRTERIPYAQFAQPAAYAQTLPGHSTPLPNVIVASEVTSMSGIQGALESGEKAAAIVLNDVKTLSRPRGG